MAKSDHLCNERKIIFVPYSLKGLFILNIGTLNFNPFTSGDKESQLSGVSLQGQTSFKIFHFALEKKFKTGISDYPSPDEIEIKKLAACFFFKPTPIFSNAEMKVIGNSIVRFFKICL